MDLLLCGACSGARGKKKRAYLDVRQGLLGSALAPALIQVDDSDLIRADLDNCSPTGSRDEDNMTRRARLLWSFVKQKWLHDKALADGCGSEWVQPPEGLWEPHQGWGEELSSDASSRSSLGHTFSEHLASFECLGDDEAWERLQRCYDESPRKGRFPLSWELEGLFDSGATSFSGASEDARPL